MRKSKPLPLPIYVRELSSLILILTPSHYHYTVYMGGRIIQRLDSESIMVSEAAVQAAEAVLFARPFHFPRLFIPRVQHLLSSRSFLG